MMMLAILASVIYYIQVMNKRKIKNKILIWILFILICYTFFLGIRSVTYSKSGENHGVRVEAESDEFDEGTGSYSISYSAGDTVRIIQYLDEDNEPTATKDGYQVRKDLLDEQGNLLAEHYYDSENNPVQRRGGYYGVLYERDENGYATKVTYLDIYDQAVNTELGYAIVVRELDQDGCVLVEMFYDQDGNQTTLNRGQYGIRHDGDKVIYLNQDGSVRFYLDYFLMNHFYLVLIFAAYLCLASCLVSRKMRVVLMLVCLAIIFYMTLYRDNTGEITPNFIPFATFFDLTTSSDVRQGLIGNLVLFIPFGMTIASIWKKKVLFILPLILSLGIEIFQLRTGLGMFDVDDILSNFAGGLIGLCLGWVIWRGNQKPGRKTKRKKNQRSR